MLSPVQFSSFSIADYIKDGMYVPELSLTMVLSVLLMVFVLSMYEFLVYRIVSRRAFYNRSFNISITAMPFFIATIILCLQSNLVITLGTIGALAILRYRTAVKDPVDMLYLLWSVHTGIVCGCGLYQVGILTSIAATLVLVLMEHLTLGKRPLILVMHLDEGAEEQVLPKLKETVSSMRIKSRSRTSRGMDYVAEISAKDPGAVSALLSSLPVERFSIVEYDSEDVL